METKKAITKGILMILTLIAFVSFGQGPALPNVATVYANIKANNHVYETLTTEYSIPNPKASKWEMTHLINAGETTTTSEFHTYKSQEGQNLNYYWPDDRAYVVFTLTTPQSSEGVTYKIPVVVEYSRIENSTLQNSWSYYWWYFEEPYETKGGNEMAELQTLFINQLKAIEPKVNGTYYGNEFPDEIKQLTAINSIKAIGNPTRDYTAGNVDYLSQTFELKGSSIRYADSDEASTEAYYPNAVVTVNISFRREKTNGKKGPWTYDGISGGNVSVNLGDAEQTKTLYGTIMNLGFDAVYQKPSTIKPIPYTSEAYSDKFEQDLKAAIIEFAKNGNEGNLKQFISPEHPEVLEQFKAYFSEMKAKCVYLGYGLSEGEDPLEIYMHRDEDPENCYVSLNVKAERPSYSREKQLKGEYKTAGISKEVMLSNEAYFFGNENLQMTIALINNQYKLVKGPERITPIPF